MSGRRNPLRIVATLVVFAVVPGAVLAVLGWLTLAGLSAVDLAAEWGWAVKSTVTGAIGGFLVIVVERVVDA